MNSYTVFKQNIWLRPDLLKAFKALVAVCITAIPFIVAGQFAFAISLTLGVIAGGVSEYGDHYKGQLKSLFYMILIFFGMAFMVNIMHINKLLFQLLFVFATVILVLFGGVSDRYQNLSMGGLLVAIYAMLGIYRYENWFVQPLFITSGAVVYSLLTLISLKLKPYRPIEEQLALGFSGLSEYLHIKARLFSTTNNANEINRQLALKNVSIVSALEKCKHLLNNYSGYTSKGEELDIYMKRFILLQSFHERVSANLEHLDEAKNKQQLKKLILGFGELLEQLSLASKKLSNSLLLGKTYQHPITTSLIIEALFAEIEHLQTQDSEQFLLFFHNLRRSDTSLQKLSRATLDSVTPALSKDTRPYLQRFTDQVKWKNIRFRYAVRLSLCFAAGFALVDILQLEKGAWVLLTSLLVNQSSYSQTKNRFYQRILGTLTGVVVAILVVTVVPTASGQLIFMFLSVSAFIYYKQRNYSMAVVFVTLFVLCSNNFVDQSGVAKMLPRIIDTLLGALLAFLSVRFLWPNWQYKRLPSLLADAFSANAAYIIAILNECKRGERPKGYSDLNYRIARRQAHKADNELSLAWQSMRIEPKGYRKFLEQAFTLTYLNHALLSNISTLSFARYNTSLITTDIEQILHKVEVTLNTASNQLTSNNHNLNSSPLKPILLELRQKINNDNIDAVSRQNLRLIYNISHLANKLLKTSQQLGKELSARPVKRAISPTPQKN